MKKTVSILLCMVLLFGMGTSAVAVDTSKTLQEVSTAKIVKPIAYTHDFDEYSNVVGVLNSDGTKTAYLFSSTKQIEQVEGITGLALPNVTPSDVQLYGWYDIEDGGSNLNSIIDAPVYSNRSNTNYGSSLAMLIGGNDTYGYGRAYIKFDISYLDSQGIAYTDIISASLNFTENQEIEGEAGLATIQAYLVKEPWDETSITWNNCAEYYYGEMIGCTNAGYNQAYYMAENPCKIYITKAVMAWLQGMDNFGIMLKEKEDEYYNRFYSSEYTAPNDSLYVTINYSDESADNIGQGIENNKSYYIVNKKTGKYLTALTNTTGTQITQQEFRDDYATTQQWKFTQTSGAVYRISLGTTNRNLKNSAGTLGSNILLGTVAATTAQTWKVFRNWNGTYRFQSQLSPYGSIKATQDVTNITQHQYLCDFSHEDEWTLIPVNKGTASFFDFDVDINTTFGTVTMTDMASDIAGYSSATVTTNGMASDGFQTLQNSGLFYFSGHGEPGVLNYMTKNQNTGKNESQGHIVVSNDLLEKWPGYSLDSLNANALAGLQLAIFSSCDTGRDAILGEYPNYCYIDENMTGKTYWLGAHNVISHFHSTFQPYDTRWLTSFMTHVLLGRSLKTAKQKADYNVYDTYMVTSNEPKPYGNMNERHDLGDESYCPGFTPAYELAKRTYSYQDIPQLSYSVNQTASTTNRVYDKYAFSYIEKKFVLPNDQEFDGWDYYSYWYDVYLDSFGGVYWYNSGTDVLHSYEPYIDNLELGEKVVDSDDAMSLAEMFLDIAGYDYTDYAVETSNDCSKEYTIMFYLPTDTTEKLIFHMQADDNGYAYITSFTAYNYNR